jgi:hypothetical protein
MSNITLHSPIEPGKPADDMNELEAQAHERAAESHALFAKAARARSAVQRPSVGAHLLTRKMYIARFGGPDGWSALVAAAGRDEIAEHRLGRAKAFREEDVLQIAATREPRKAVRPKAVRDTNPRAAYLALVSRGGAK